MPLLLIHLMLVAIVVWCSGAIPSLTMLSKMFITLRRFYLLVGCDSDGAFSYETNGEDELSK